MHITRLMIAAAISLTAIACAEKPDPDTRGAVVLWESPEPVVRAGVSPVTQLAIEVPSDASTFFAEDNEIVYACGCDTQQCIDDWAQKNYDCGICVTMNCGSRLIGSCPVCPAEELPLINVSEGGQAQTIQ